MRHVGGPSTLPPGSPKGPGRLSRLSPGQLLPSQPTQPGLACSHPMALTHDGQRCGLAQLVPHGVDDLEPTPVQIAAVDGVVPGADPVEFAFREVNSQAWKRVGGEHGTCPSRATSLWECVRGVWF